MPDHRTPTRRQLLAAAGVAVAAGVSGCAEAARDSGSDRGEHSRVRERTGGSTGDSTVGGTGDTALAERSARQAAALLAAYRSTLRGHDELGRALRPLGKHHAEHLAVLAPEKPPRIGVVAVPRTRQDAVLALRRREQAVARSRRSATIDASSGDLARILASVVACQAQHVQILDRLLDATADEQVQGQRR